MSGAEEEWVKAAMTDDTMVVDLLVRLHCAPAAPRLRPPALPPLEWSVRQRRSKHASVNGGNPKKQAQRASPTTPLSWSGATSPSGGSGGGGDEESSRPAARKLPSAAGSKVNGDSEKTASKRARKKKTLAELKDEESSLIKERRELKKELAALRVNLEKQRATNDNLKRMKIELQPLPDTDASPPAEETISDQLHQTATTAHDPIVSDNADTLLPSTSNGYPEPNPEAASDPKFVLPDLNMPFEDDLVCGVS